MSLAFVLFCLWLLAALPSGLLPLQVRGRVRLGLLAAGAALVLLALLTQGLVVALFALAGVLAVFPQPLALAAEMLRVRIAALRGPAAA
jgi:hypothetical protein